MKSKTPFIIIILVVVIAFMWTIFGDVSGSNDLGNEFSRMVK